jgi:hypothetical protein
MYLLFWCVAILGVFHLLHQMHTAWWSVSYGPTNVRIFIFFASTAWKFPQLYSSRYRTVVREPRATRTNRLSVRNTLITQNFTNWLDKENTPRWEECTQSSGASTAPVFVASETFEVVIRCPDIKFHYTCFFFFQLTFELSCNKLIVFPLLSLLRLAKDVNRRQHFQNLTNWVMVYQTVPRKLPKGAGGRSVLRNYSKFSCSDTVSEIRLVPKI